MIKKRALVFRTVIIVITMIVSSLLVLAKEDNIKVEIDAVGVTFDDETGYPFVDENNRIQVPLKATLEGFGATVSWQNESNTAIVNKDGISIEIPVGKSYIITNGISIENDTDTLIKEDRIYLPIRIVMEAFGSNVNWNSELRTIEITNIEEEEKDIEEEEKDIEKDEKDIEEEEKDIEKDEKDVEEDSKDKEDKKDTEEDTAAEETEFRGKVEGEEDTGAKDPEIYLDNKIPEVTNKAVFTISGTCENVEYIEVVSPIRLSQRIEPINNKFSCTVEIGTNAPEAMKEKGIANAITIIAYNGNKVLVKDYIVYYNEK